MQTGINRWLQMTKSWAQKKDDGNKFQAAEWFFRRLLRVSWKERRINDCILEELVLEITLLTDKQK